MSLSVIFKPAGLPFVCPENKSLCCSFHPNIFYPFLWEDGQSKLTNFKFLFLFVFCPKSQLKTMKWILAQLGDWISFVLDFSAQIELSTYLRTSLRMMERSYTATTTTNTDEREPIFVWSRQVNCSNTIKTIETSDWLICWAGLGWTINCWILLWLLRL